MSRRNYRSTKTLPTVRAPRSARHRRRNRAIRHVSAHGPVTSAGVPYRHSRSPRLFWRQLFRNGILWVPIVFLGAGVSMTLGGLVLGRYAHERTLYSMNVRAGQMFLPTVIVTAVGLSTVEGRLWRKWGRRLQLPDGNLIPLAALLTGVLVLSLPLQLGALESIAACMHGRFVLSDPLIRIGQLVSWVPLCVLCLVAFRAMGILLASEKSMASKAQYFTALGLGLSFGILLSVGLSQHAGLLLPAGSLPFFLITLFAANFGPSKSPAPITH